MAVTVSQRKPSVSYAIVYGFISGKAHGHELEQQLRARGYTPSDDLEHADIIITHSAGCSLLSSRLSPKLVIFVGPTLNKLTLTNWLRANARNIQAFFADHHIRKGLALNLMHLWYGLSHPRYNWKLLQTTKQGSLPTFPESIVVLIANRYDPWPQLANWEAYTRTRPWSFMGLAGAHENIWEMPEIYAAIIDQYAKRLLVQADR